jgi:hypothetical protein
MRFPERERYALSLRVSVYALRVFTPLWFIRGIFSRMKGKSVLRRRDVPVFDVMMSFLPISRHH